MREPFAQQKCHRLLSKAPSPPDPVANINPELSRAALKIDEHEPRKPYETAPRMHDAPYPLVLIALVCVKPSGGLRGSQLGRTGHEQRRESRVAFPARDFFKRAFSPDAGVKPHLN